MFNILGYDREIVDRVLNESLVIPLELKKKIQLFVVNIHFLRRGLQGMGK